MVLIGLLFKCFIENLSSFPNHVIHVSKQDVLNIESIEFKQGFSAVNITTSSSTMNCLNLKNYVIFIQFVLYR